MKKFILFIFLSIAILLVLVLIVVRSNRSPEVPVPAVAETPATSSAQYQPQELTPEQRADYLATYKDPFVLYLRTALDGYLAGKGSEVGVDAFTIEKNVSDTMISGLAAFDQDYYRSKFIVYAVNPAPFGGKEVSIIFRDKPDKMFTAWIYQTGENSFTLNGFWQPSSITDGKMAILRVMLKPLLDDEASSM